MQALRFRLQRARLVLRLGARLDLRQAMPGLLSCGPLLRQLGLPLLVDRGAASTATCVSYPCTVNDLSD